MEQFRGMLGGRGGQLGGAQPGSVRIYLVLMVAECIISRVIN